MASSTPPLLFSSDRDYLVEKYGPLTEHQDSPPYWLFTPEEAEPFIAGLREWKRRPIGASHRGREIFALEYGPGEALEGIASTSLHSSICSKILPCDPTRIYPPAFYGSRLRERPVIALQGGIHGGEITGTIGAFNLASVVETGRDLRGREWPRLAELARRTRILFIPWLNPDGCARFRTPNPTRVSAELAAAQTHGLSRSGRLFDYREQKAFWPLDFSDIGHLGAYYNEAGYNLQYDLFQLEPQPETLAWMRYYLDERPDAVLAFHCNNGSLIGPPEYYLPPGHQHALSRLAGAVNAACRREGYRDNRLSWADLPAHGKPYMEQSTATYHVCGALPVLIEFPAGFEGTGYDCDGIVDIALTCFEEVFAYALTEGLRPYHWRQKELARQK